VDSGSSKILQAEDAMGGQFASSLGYSFSYDTRTGGLDPNGGILLRFGQDLAGFGGDQRSITTSALAVAERRVMNDDLTLRAVFEGGMLNMIKGDSRVTERFFGNGKIRGFEANGLGPRDLSATNQDALGGNMYAVTRFESEFPIGLPEEYNIKGGAFFDVGSVWSLDNVNGGLAGADIVDDSMKLRASVGVSLFWTTPIGPLRFNFSKALKKETYDKTRSFDLTISSEF
jgi:outer membrane protein insertion porin family